MRAFLAEIRVGGEIIHQAMPCRTGRHLTHHPTPIAGISIFAALGGISNEHRLTPTHADRLAKGASLLPTIRAPLIAWLYLGREDAGRCGWGVELSCVARDYKNPDVVGISDSYGSNRSIPNFVRLSHSHGGAYVGRIAAR